MSNVLNTYGSPIEEQMALDTQMEALAVSERKRVLLVDNDPNLFQSVWDYLEFYSGYEITTAKDNWEALEVLEQEQEFPNPIVSVNCEHSLNRYDLFSFTKQNERTREIPSLSFACSDPNQIKLRFPYLDVVIQQPFELEELLAQLKSLLKA